MTTDTMLAGVYLGPKNISAVSRPIPKADKGEVIIKIARAGICGTDVHTYLHGGFMPEGTTLGHEFSGHIVEIGEGVIGYNLGQRVTANPMSENIGLFADGAFAQYLRLPNAALNKTLFAIPDSLSHDLAALIEPLAVALRGVKHCTLNSDSNILIQGLGTIGLCALLIAKQHGIKNIVAIDQQGPRLALAKSLGAKTVALGEEDLASVLTQHFGEQQSIIPGPKLDAVIDATGNEVALGQAINLLSPQGQLLVLGTYPAPINVDMTFFVAKELRMIGSLAYQDEFAEALALIADGAVDVSPLISHHFALKDIDQAFAKQADPINSIKVMLDISNE